MKQVVVYSMGALPPFGVATDDPGYWSERLCFELSRNLYEMNQAGFALQQGEEADVGTFEQEFDTYRDNLAAWLLQAWAAQQEGSRALVPALPMIGGALMAAIKGLLTSPQAWGVVIMKAIELIMTVVAKRAEHKQTVDFSDVVDVLKAAFLDENEEPLLGDNAGVSDKVAELSRVVAVALTSFHEDENGQIVVDASLLERILTDFGIDINTYRGDRMSVSFGSGYTETAP